MSKSHEQLAASGLQRNGCLENDFGGLGTRDEVIARYMALKEENKILSAKLAMNFCQYAEAVKFLKEEIKELRRYAKDADAEISSHGRELAGPKTPP